jgi:hypothetical protein
MAAPAVVLPGFSASMWMQTGASPTAFSTANLAVWTGQVATIVGTTANGTGAAGHARSARCTRPTRAAKGQVAVVRVGAVGEG